MNPISEKHFKISEKIERLNNQQNLIHDIICDIHSQTKLLNDTCDLEPIDNKPPVNLQIALDSLIFKNDVISSNLEKIISHLKNNL